MPIRRPGKYTLKSGHPHWPPTPPATPPSPYPDPAANLAALTDPINTCLTSCSQSHQPTAVHPPRRRGRPRVLACAPLPPPKPTPSLPHLASYSHASGPWRPQPRCPCPATARMTAPECWSTWPYPSTEGSPRWCGGNPSASGHTLRPLRPLRPLTLTPKLKINIKRH